MGAARLRIAAFPTASDAADAHRWRASAGTIKPKYPTTASHCYSGDTLDGLSDGFEPASSNDHEIPRMTWWDHRGTVEWVQYDFAAPKTISSTAVYWFDDSGVGECRVPESWRLLYRSADLWIPLGAEADFKVRKDAWNRVQFPAIETTAIRVEAQLQPHFSGGLLGWTIN